MHTHFSGAWLTANRAKKASGSAERELFEALSTVDNLKTGSPDVQMRVANLRRELKRDSFARRLDVKSRRPALARTRVLRVNLARNASTIVVDPPLPQMDQKEAYTTDSDHKSCNETYRAVRKYRRAHSAAEESCA